MKEFVINAGTLMPRWFKEPKNAAPIPAAGLRIRTTGGQEIMVRGEVSCRAVPGGAEYHCSGRWYLADSVVGVL